MDKLSRREKERRMREAIEKGKTGFEKIKLAFMACFHFYKDFPESFRLMNAVGQVKKAEFQS